MKEKLDFEIFFGGACCCPKCKTWEERVSQLEAEGYDRSDAQGAVDVEILKGWRPSDFQPWMLLPQITTDPHSTI